MKICWDTLENVRLTKNGLFIKNTTIYYYGECCEECSQDFLYVKRNNYKYNGRFCSRSCTLKGGRSWFSNLGRKNHPSYGTIGVNGDKYGDKSTNWRGGVTKLNVPLYDTYGERLSKYQEIRRCVYNFELLEVVCKTCGQWFLPSMSAVVERLKCIEKTKYSGESHLYCSDKCKKLCSLYGQNPGHIISRDKYKNNDFLTKRRDTGMQKDFRYVISNKASKVCELCGAKDDKMIAHHITPVKTCDDILTWDIDNGLYLCYHCNKRAHSSNGCRYVDLSSN